MSERDIVFLAGMHRSGTSALARVLNLLGAVLPEPLAPAALGNELGHWEPAEAVAMNDRALLAAGSDVNSLQPLSPAWIAESAGAFVDEAAAWLDRVAPQDRVTVVKDPRISILAPWWRAAAERLGVRPRFVVSWRDPVEVARSLLTRQLEHFPDEAWPPARGELLWLKHQLAAEHASRGLRRSFAAYPSLLADWRGETARVLDQLELPQLRPDPAAAAAIDAFLQPDAHRQRAGDAEPATPLVGRSVDLLRARRDDPDGGAAEFDAVSARLDAALAVLGPYVATLEARWSGDPQAAARTEDLRVVVDALRRAAETAQAQAAERRDGQAATPADVDLIARHEGLRLAYAQALAEAAQARSAFATEASDLRRELARARSDVSEEASKLRNAHEEVMASTAAIFEGRLAESASGMQLERRKLKSQHQRAEEAQARSEAAETRAEALAAEVTRLGVEVADHRDAYEALRREIAGLRDAPRAPRPAPSDTASAAAVRRDLVDTRAALLAVEAELTALHASSSWRLTRPMRSATVRLRRWTGR